MLDFHNVHEHYLCPDDSCWLLITLAGPACQRSQAHCSPLQLGGIQGEMQAQSSNGKKPISCEEGTLRIPILFPHCMPLYVHGNREAVAQRCGHACPQVPRPSSACSEQQQGTLAVSTPNPSLNRPLHCCHDNMSTVVTSLQAQQLVNPR